MCDDGSGDGVEIEVVEVLLVHDNHQNKMTYKF